MDYKPTRKAFCFILFSFLLGIPMVHHLYGQIKEDFTPRYSNLVRGDYVTIANNILSRHATDPYNGEGNNDWFTDNVFVDIDTDATTFNSSSANLINPSPFSQCLTYNKVLLYWAAADKEPDSLGNMVNPNPDWDYRQVKLRLPGEIGYTTLVADEVLYWGAGEHFYNDPYICVKDITDRVQALDNPHGTYQVANVKARTGYLTSHDSGINTGTSGGWQMVFVYESPELLSRRITLFDGYAQMSSQESGFEVEFDGFLTVPNGEVKANLLIGALEGDRDIYNDQLQILDVNDNWTALSTSEVDSLAIRPVNNFFNSRITNGNEAFMDRVPASANTLGFDAGIFALRNTGNSLITNDQTSAKVRMTSDQEIYGLYLLGLSVQVWEPALKNFMLNVVSGDTTYGPEEVVSMSLNLENAGNDNIQNLVVFTEIPETVGFMGVQTLPPGVSHSYDTVTRILEFQIEDGFTDPGSDPYQITFNIQMGDACILSSNVCTDQIPFQFTAEYRGVLNPVQQTVLSSGTLSNCGLGNYDEVFVGVDISGQVRWNTLIGDLDTTVGCNDGAALRQAQEMEPVPFLCSTTMVKTSGDFEPSNDCNIAGTFTNRWVYTDACGRQSEEYVQVITIQNDAPPTVVGLDTPLTITCGDPIPAVPDVSFTGMCEALEVQFSEATEGQDGFSDYTIIRTWDVRYNCTESTLFEQRILVQQPAPKNELFQSMCIWDDSVDLYSFLSEAEWVKDGFFYSLEGDELPQGLFVPKEYDVGSHTFTYLESNGTCLNTVDIVLTLYGECDEDCNSENIGISKAITLNGDGINDFFEIKSAPGCNLKYNITVFNRWGTIVFRAKDYDNTWAGEAPTNSMGSSKVLPTGTYYYIIVAEGLDQWKPRTGYIYLGSN